MFCLSFCLQIALQHPYTKILVLWVYYYPLCFQSPFSSVLLEMTEVKCRICFLQLPLQLQDDGLVPWTPRISYLTCHVLQDVDGLYSSCVIFHQDCQSTNQAVNIKSSRVIIGFFTLVTRTTPHQPVTHFLSY